LSSGDAQNVLFYVALSTCDWIDKNEYIRYTNLLILKKLIKASQDRDKSQLTLCSVPPPKNVMIFMNE